MKKENWSTLSFGSKRNCRKDVIESFMLIANETVAEHLHDWSVHYHPRRHPKQKSGRSLSIMLLALDPNLRERLVRWAKKPLQEIMRKANPMQMSFRWCCARCSRPATEHNHNTMASGCEYYTSIFTSPIQGRYPTWWRHRRANMKIWSGRSLCVLPDIASQS